MKKALLLWAGYTIFWIGTRWPAISQNPLFFDDFGIPFAPAGFYVGSYRPVVWLEYIFWEMLVPDHFWTMLPKLTGAVYLGATATALVYLLERWGISFSIAALTSLLALSNPVLNDAGLWSSLHAIPLGLLFITLGALAWDKPTPARLTAAFAWIFAGVLTYQIFASLALVYVVAEYVIKRILGTQPTLKQVMPKLLVLGVASALQMLYMELARDSGSDSRGFVRTSSTLLAFAQEKMHGVFDLTVNGIMPVVAWYSSATIAYSWWRIVPVGIAAATGAVAVWKRKSLLTAGLAAAFPIALLFVPALPVLILSQSPYAWRVSSPVAIAFAFTLVPLALMIRGSAVILVAALFLVPVSFDEARMRLVSRDREASLIAEIAAHWKPRDVTIVYGPQSGWPEDVRLIRSRDLTWGYERRTPEMWTSFQHAWFAEQYVSKYHEMRFIDCSAGQGSAICQQARSLCALECTQSSTPYPRVIHMENRMTLVCTGALRQPATLCPEPLPTPGSGLSSP